MAEVFPLLLYEAPPVAGIAPTPVINDVVSGGNLFSY